MADAGAPEFEIDTRWDETIVEIEDRPMFVEGVATVIGSGRPQLEG